MLWLILLLLIPIVIAEIYMVSRWGKNSWTIVCQHCGAEGKVRVKQVRQTARPYDGQAQNSTGGWPMLVDGLRRKETVTQAHCSHCGMTWYLRKTKKDESGREVGSH